MEMKDICPYLASTVVLVLLAALFAKRHKPNSASWDLVAVVTIATGLSVHIFRN